MFASVPTAISWARVDSGRPNTTRTRLRLRGLLVVLRSPGFGLSAAPGGTGGDWVPPSVDSRNEGAAVRIRASASLNQTVFRSSTSPVAPVDERIDWYSRTDHWNRRFRQGQRRAGLSPRGAPQVRARVKVDVRTHRAQAGETEVGVINPTLAGGTHLTRRRRRIRSTPLSPSRSPDDQASSRSWRWARAAR